MLARKLVGAVGADEQDRSVGERRRRSRRAAPGSPRRTTAGRRARAARRARARRRRARSEPPPAGPRVHLFGRRAELRQQQTQVRPERPAILEGARLGAQVRAQGGDDRAVGRGRVVAGGAAQHRRLGRRAASSSRSRVLPTPASPARSTSPPSPRTARSSSSPRRARSRSRPIKPPAAIGRECR